MSGRSSRRPRQLAAGPIAGVVALCLALALPLAAAAQPVPGTSRPAGPGASGGSSALVRRVSYGGLTILVPAWWTVESRTADACGTAGPAALYGAPPPPVRYACPAFRRLAVVVTLGGGDLIRPVGKETRHKVHGVLTVVSSRLVAGGGTVLVARFPGRSVWFTASAPRPGAPASSGGGIGVVRRILATVHPA